ncbi:MAG: threonylcarbamoyl-AMP synthase [Actinomycetales bacterium]|nr:threonylcarbamoyl-AMP synthase [Actinomycetales bacterium]
MSEIHDCTTSDGRSAAVAAAAAAVRAGQIVVLPTDTVYGVGCDAFDAAAVRAVLAAKGRGRDMPPPVLVPNPRTVDGLAREVPDYARALIERCWPGPLTLVLKAQSSLRWDLGDTNGTVAVRMPDDPIALDLLREVGPMAVTSANRTGMPPATTATDARDQLGEAVGVYLDGGERRGSATSTILDCTGAEPMTLRVGALAQDEIDRVVTAARAQATQEAAVASAAAALEAARLRKIAAREEAVRARAGDPRRRPNAAKIAGSRRRD